VKLCADLARRSIAGATDGHPEDVDKRVDSQVRLLEVYERRAPVVGTLQAIWHICANAEESKRFTYFIQAGEGGPIKIGIATNVRARLSGLQTGSHEALRLIGAIPGGADAERFLHQLFAAHHIRGEWFRPDETMLGFITDLISSYRQAFPQ